MADPIDLTPLATATALQPREAIEFFRAKGYAPPEGRYSWRDWWGASHARGFVVAKAMQDDLLATIREAVDEAIAGGWTMEQFRAALEPKLKAAGWWGRKSMTDPLTGETRIVQLGSKRRLAVIFDTNLRTAYAAGRWMRIQRTKEVFPYLEYIQLQRASRRAAHQPFHGLVVPVDHIWWAAHFPPNGYFCACTTRQLSARALERRGLTVATEPPMETRSLTDPRTGRSLEVPKGITPGFETNPGATFLAEQGRHDAIAEGLDPVARGIELGLIHEARARGLRTGNEHLAAIDLDADTPVRGGNAAPVEWVEGARDRVDLSPEMLDILRDPARRIGVVHNHPDSAALSSVDLEQLEKRPGLVRVVAVGHDGSLFRATDPRPGLGHTANRLWQLATLRINEQAAGLDMNAPAMQRLASHAATSALDRAGYVNYAHAIAGGSRVNLMRFGEDRMEQLIAGLLEWLVS